MPTSIFDPGFQLSFAAVAAIFAAVPRTRALLAGSPLPSRLTEACAVARSRDLRTREVVVTEIEDAPLVSLQDGDDVRHAQLLVGYLANGSR